MSKLARKPILLDKVKLSFKDNIVYIEGPLGKLSLELKHPQFVKLRQEDNNLFVERLVDNRQGKMYQGLYYALIRNMVKGVTEGYKKVLEIVGVGYQAKIEGDETQGYTLVLKLGFSHPVKFQIPKGIKPSVDQKGTEITLFGIDKWLVGETAAQIRKIKPPEPYKGTGIKYKDEHIIRKPGKAAITTAAGGKK